MKIDKIKNVKKSKNIQRTEKLIEDYGYSFIPALNGRLMQAKPRKGLYSVITYLKNFSMKEKITKKSLPKTLNQSKAFLIFSLLFFRKERVFFTQHPPLFLISCGIFPLQHGFVFCWVRRVIKEMSCVGSLLFFFAYLKSALFPQSTDLKSLFY